MTRYTGQRDAAGTAFKGDSASGDLTGSYEADAKRYRWLRERLLAADFDWNDSGECVLVFQWPSHVAVGGNCDQNIDAAMAAGEAA